MANGPRENAKLTLTTTTTSLYYIQCIYVDFKLLDRQGRFLGFPRDFGRNSHRSRYPHHKHT